MTLIQHIALACHAFRGTHSYALLGVTVVALVLTITLSALHELGHWVMARLFGIKGRFVFFPQYGKSALGWMAVMAIDLPDDEIEHLGKVKYRIVAAAGGIVEALVAVLCLYSWFHLPVPAWIAHGVATVGLTGLAGAAMNLTPMKIGANVKNDGWQILYPPVR